MPLDPEQIINQSNTGSANFNPTPIFNNNQSGPIPNGLPGVNTNSIIDYVKNHIPTVQTQPKPTIPFNIPDYPTTTPAKTDHFFDVNPLDQAKFDADQAQNKWQNDFDMAKFNWDKSIQDKQLAISQGNLDLAIQAQKDENYWKGQTLAAQERMNSANNAANIQGHQIDANAAIQGHQITAASNERMNTASNAASIQGHQIDAQAQIQAATISAASARYASDLRFQSDMANAINDAERNKISLVHEQEYAVIAKMEDDTKRAIAAQENNIRAFDAESTRAYQMGDLALKNNQFLLDASTKPRDLFGLYFMQRGMTPDWNTILNGGTPAQGQALAPVNPMSAYIPKITMPTDFTIGAGPSYGNVGNASKLFTLGNNPFIGQQQHPQEQITNQPQVNQPQTQQVNQPQTQINQQVTQPITGSPNNADFGVNEKTISGFNTPLPVISGGKGQGLMPIRYAEGSGYTTAKQFMAGDAPSQNPWDGGAMPEIINNPTGAPISVKNSTQTAADFGIQKPTGGIDAIQIRNLIEQIRMQNLARMMQSLNSSPAGVGPTPQIPQQQQVPIPMPQQSAINQQLGPAAKAMGTDMTNPMLSQAAGLMRNQMPRFAYGTDSGFTPMSGYPSNPNTINWATISNGGDTIDKPGWNTISPQVDYGMAYGGKSSGGNNNPGSWTRQDWNNGSYNNNYTQPQNQYYPPPVDIIDQGVQGNYIGQPIQQQNPAKQQFPIPINPLPPVPVGDPFGGNGTGIGQNNITTRPYDNTVNADFPVQVPPIPLPPIPTGDPFGGNGTGIGQGNTQPIPLPPVPVGDPIGGNSTGIGNNPAYDGNRGHMAGIDYNLDNQINSIPAQSSNIPPGYTDNGLSQLWLQNSQNQYLQGQPLPPALAALARYGVPISPALYSSVSANILPSLNGAAAFTGRGGGVLPSLRTLNSMTPGEQDLFGNGYTQGVLGLDWKDIADFISRPTMNLGQARTSQGFW